MIPHAEEESLRAPRYNVTSTCRPNLSISGGTATCVLRADANSGAEIKGTLTLYRGSTEVESWKIDETTRVRFSDTAKATSGYTFKLVADLTVTSGSKSDDVYEYVTYDYR